MSRLAASSTAAQQTPAVPAGAAGSAIPGLPPGLPPGVVANLAATLAAIPGATIIVVPPSPNANQ
ncbi:PPE family protein [Mycobacterium tuberculosis]|nr:PPE family protein [Mycobacterium tuberculosis]